MATLPKVLISRADNQIGEGVALGLRTQEGRMGKARRRRQEILELGNMPREIKGSMCAWESCPAHFKDPMPRGWIWLVTYWAPEPVVSFGPDRPRPEDWYRDGVLCPDHARKLERLLKPLGRALAGSAKSHA
jgi:hypothetical protein